MGIDRNSWIEDVRELMGKLFGKVVHARYVVRSWDCSGKRLSEAGKLKSRTDIAWMFLHGSCSSTIPRGQEAEDDRLWN